MVKLLLWVTCTGHYWLVALCAMIGAITEVLLLLAHDHCTVIWVLHPGGGARYYLIMR